MPEAPGGLKSRPHLSRDVQARRQTVLAEVDRRRASAEKAGQVYNPRKDTKLQDFVEQQIDEMRQLGRKSPEFARQLGLLIEGLAMKGVFSSVVNDILERYVW